MMPEAIELDELGVALCLPLETVRRLHQIEGSLATLATVRGESGAGIIGRHEQADYPLLAALSALGMVEIVEQFEKVERYYV
jgi:hypothetical protein